MDSPFFDGIEWDGIYERRQDGPYIPELPAFLSNRKASLIRMATTSLATRDSVVAEAAAALDGEGAGVDGAVMSPTKPAGNLLVFSPPPFARVNDDSKEPAITPAVYEDGKGGDENKEDGSEEDEDSEEEVEMQMRDSVFIFSQGQNRLPDWSYIDEAVLAEYLTQEAKERAEIENGSLMDNVTKTPKSEKKKKRSTKSEKAEATEATTTGDETAAAPDAPPLALETPTVAATTGVEAAADTTATTATTTSTVEAEAGAGEETHTSDA